jgi:hypothetical protein
MTMPLTVLLRAISPAALLATLRTTLAAPFAARIIARFPGADGLTGLHTDIY